MTLAFDFSGFLYFASGLIFGVLIGPAFFSLFNAPHKFVKGFNFAATSIITAEDPAEKILYLLNEVEEAKTFKSFTDFDRGVEAAVELYVTNLKHSEHVVSSYKKRLYESY